MTQVGKGNFDIYACQEIDASFVVGQVNDRRSEWRELGDVDGFLRIQFQFAIRISVKQRIGAAGFRVDRLKSRAIAAELDRSLNAPLFRAD